ncbi:helix-turn-helix domain-containing protein [Pseudomonas profundi]|uniref:helix-turn-helix domain-containing protein n=1 Tax=Pseudomonas profundi TaxID=1981513 RepID=UPI001CC25F5D|nr:helix-turn-helix transcriptional regulator [Pseudomonas profundi]
MKATTGELRKQLIEEIIQLHTDGELTLGMAIRRLRLEVTGFDQETFAQMCGMSTRALYQLETDKGNPTLSTVDSILRKFGLRMGLMAAMPAHRRRVIAGERSSVSQIVKGEVVNRKVTHAISRGAKPKGTAGNRPAVGTSRKIAKKETQKDGPTSEGDVSQ